MSTHLVHSDQSLQTFLGDIRAMYSQHHYLKINVRIGKDRSMDQNAISHVFYEQLSRELREDDANGWKRFSKLHFGVPILRAEDEQFRTFYDGALKSLSYEQKLKAMEYVPVTSIMTKPQLSRYLETMQEHFLQHGVRLEFPAE
jgi:hypothetical protein